MPAVHKIDGKGLKMKIKCEQKRWKLNFFGLDHGNANGNVLVCETLQK